MTSANGPIGSRPRQLDEARPKSQTDCPYVRHDGAVPNRYRRRGVENELKMTEISMFLSNSHSNRVRADRVNILPFGLGATVVAASVLLAPTIVAARSATPVAADAAADHWSGGYAGLTAGYESSNRNVAVAISDPMGSLVDPSGLTQAVLLPDHLGADRSGFAYGLKAGYNQIVAPHVLIGIEADVTLNDKTAAGSFAGTFNDPKQPVPAYTSLSTAQTRTSWLSTLRARAGFASGRFLGFATAGLALGKTRSQAQLTISNTGNPPSDSYAGQASQTKVGFTVGGGAEYAISHSVGFTVEYQHYRLPALKYVASPDAFTTTDQPGVSQTLSYRPAGDIVRVGLTYHFH